MLLRDGVGEREHVGPSSFVSGGVTGGRCRCCIRHIAGIGLRRSAGASGARCSDHLTASNHRPSRNVSGTTVRDRVVPRPSACPFEHPTIDHRERLRDGRSKIAVDPFSDFVAKKLCALRQGPPHTDAGFGHDASAPALASPSRARSGLAAAARANYVY
jgi:hypothetical protein